MKESGMTSKKSFYERNNWKNPTKEMMDSPEFNSVWDLIKDWEISILDKDGVFTSIATGNHVKAILDSITNGRSETVKNMVDKLRSDDLGGSTRKAVVEKLHSAIHKNIT